MLFSQRNGYKPVKEYIQFESIDEALRNGLWDTIANHYLDLLNEVYKQDIYLLVKNIWHLYFKKPSDTIPRNESMIYQEIRDYYFSCNWYEVYDFVEFLQKYYEPDIRTYDRNKINENFRNTCNEILERENSGFRFVGENILKITSEQEIKAIESVYEYDEKYKVVKIHINSALNLLSDRNNRDFRNSIKESISAVEALCKIYCEAALINKIKKRCSCIQDAWRCRTSQ